MCNVIETMVVLLVCWKLYFYTKSPLTNIVSHFLVFVFSVLVSILFIVLYDVVFSEYEFGFVGRIVVPVMGLLLLYILPSIFFRKIVITKIEELKKKIKSHCIYQGLRYLFLFSWMFFVTIILYFMVNLFYLLPEVSGTIAQHSLFLHTFVDDEIEEQEMDEDTLRVYQGRLFGGVASGIRNTKDYLSEITGSKALLTRIAIAKELSELSEVDRVWLIDNNKALSAIVNNKSLEGVMSNGDLLSKIIKASQGDIEMISVLMTNKDLEKLFEDKEMAAAIAEIDLLKLREQIKNKDR